MDNKEYLATIKFYKKLGKEMQKQASHTKAYLQLVKKFIKHQDKALDVGCGYGRILIPLVKNKFDVYGIEFVSDYVKEANKQLKKLNFKPRVKIGNMVKLPFKNNQFDKVVCLWSTFTHLISDKDQIKAINEIYRVLDKNGSALIDVPNGDLKYFKEFMKKEGFGNGKKLFKTQLGKEHTIRFMHDENTLKKVVAKSHFTNYQIKKFNIKGLGQQLIILLNKAKKI